MERAVRAGAAPLAQLVRRLGGATDRLSLAAITLLSRRTWLLVLTSAVASFGITLALFALFQAAPLPFAVAPALAGLGAAVLTEVFRRLGRRVAH